MTNAELALAFDRPVLFNVVDLRECLPLGQRIEAFALDEWKDGEWHEFAKGTSIGNRRLVRTRYLTTEKVRLRIAAAASPALSELGLYAEPVMLGSPKISRNKQGLVTLALENPGPHIHYTLDGSEPNPGSLLFEKPFPLPKGGTVRARAFSPQSGSAQEEAASDATTETFGLSKARWSVVYASYQSPAGGEAVRAIDDRPETLWHTHGPQGERKPPQEIIVDLGETLEVTAFTYLPRRDGLARGLVDKFEVYLGENPDRWDRPAAAGEFANIKANPILQTIRFPSPVKARFFRFVALRVVEGNHVAVAELGVEAK